MDEVFTINKPVDNLAISFTGQKERLIHREPPCQVMVEGPGGSGKSTLMRQYSLLHDIQTYNISEGLEDGLGAFGMFDGHLKRNTMFVSEPPPFFGRGTDRKWGPINVRGEVLDESLAERMICGENEPSGKTALNQLRRSNRYTHEAAITLLTHARLGLSRYVKQEKKGLIVHDRGYPSTLVYNCDWEGENEDELKLLLNEKPGGERFLVLAQKYYDEYVGVPDKETVEFINYLFMQCPDFVYDIFFLLQSDSIAEPLQNLFARKDDRDPFDYDLKNKILALCRYKAIARLIREGPLAFLCKELVVVSPDYSSGPNKISWPALALSTLQNYAYYRLSPVKTDQGLLYETLLNGAFSHSFLFPENTSLREAIEANPITKYLSYIYASAYNTIEAQRPSEEGIIFPEQLVFGDVRFGIRVLQENMRNPNLSIFMLRRGW